MPAVIVLGMIDVVCGVIEDGEGRFLACLRPSGKHMGGRWEFPGGKVGEGELPQDALVRELLEELDVEVRVGSVLRPVEWRDENGWVRLLPFRCEVMSGEPRAVEHERIGWFVREDFRMLAWADADVPVLGEILSL